VTTTDEGPKEKAIWLDHWRDKADAAFLYRKLSAAEHNPESAAVQLGTGNLPPAN
jgi:hypothetical protein